MKIISNTARLNEACQNVQRAVSSKATLPAIEGILMKASGGQVQLCGYDMEMGITTVQEARVEEEGAIVLNARLLCDILRRLPGETVSIEADARQLCTIRCGEVEYQLVGIAAEEYPELPTVTEEVPVVIDSETLEKMVLYRALYGEKGFWVRPAHMWSETVEKDGIFMRRFTYIGEKDKKNECKSL